MSDIKKLKKLYAEYQKIKGMSDGGKVEHDKHNIKELKISFNKFMDEESKEPKKYSNGGEVDTNSDNTLAGIARSNVARSLTDALGMTDPEPAPTPKNSLSDKYAKIRSQNSENASGKTSVMDQKTYSDGGEVKPDKEIVAKQIIPLDGPVNKPSNNDPRYGGTLDLGKTLDNLPNYDDGGEVQGSNPVLDVIQKMGQAFGSSAPAPQPSLDDKYANVRAQNAKQFGYADGGEVEEGGTVEPEDSDEDSNANPIPDVPEKQTMDLGDIPVMVAKKPEDEPYADEEEDAHKKSDATSDAQLALEKLDDDKLDELHAHVTAEKEKRDQEKDSDESKEDEEVDSKPDDSQFSKLMSSVKPEQSSLQDQLAQAQKEQKAQAYANQMSKADELLAAGIAGHGAQAASPAYINNDLQKLPIENLSQKLELQQKDPESSMSQIARQYYKSKGINVPENASYEDISKVAPFYLKDAALKNAIDKVTMQQQGAGERASLAAKTKQDVAAANQAEENKRAAARNAIEKQKADAAMESAKGNKELKAQAGQDRALQQTKQMLESARGNPAAAQAEKDIYSVDKANSLFKLYPNLDKIPDAQVNLVTSEIAKVAQGGVPTGHEMDSLRPNTPESRLQKLFGQVQNQPTGANLGAYLKELKKYTDALHGDAQKVIQDKYGRVIESSKKQLGDDNYKMLQDQYLNRFNTAASSPVHPEDAKAIEWAKANPGNPKAAQILKVNGIQ